MCESSKSKLINWGNVIPALALIVTIIFGVREYNQSQEFKKEDQTIRLIDELRSPDFLNKQKIYQGVLRKLNEDPNWDFFPSNVESIRTIYEDNEASYDQLRKEFKEDIFSVFHAYENIALLSNKGHVDEKLIKEYTGSQICDFVQLFIPKNGRRLMKKEFVPESKSLKPFLLATEDCDSIGENWLWE